MEKFGQVLVIWHPGGASPEAGLAINAIGLIDAAAWGFGVGMVAGPAGGMIAGVTAGM